MAIAAFFQSWSSPAAKQYRDVHGISQELGTGITVQSMVYGTMNETCGTGLISSRNGLTGEKGGGPYGLLICMCFCVFMCSCVCCNPILLSRHTAINLNDAPYYPCLAEYCVDSDDPLLYTLGLTIATLYTDLYYDQPLINPSISFLLASSTSGL
jgi:hypothetical protein